MKKNYAPFAWVVGIIAMLVYELWSVFNSVPNDTLSEAVWEHGQHPMFALAVGILIGHFFWQRAKED
jgi:hypothetical protein